MARDTGLASAARAARAGESKARVRQGLAHAVVVVVVVVAAGAERAHHAFGLRERTSLARSQMTLRPAQPASRTALSQCSRPYQRGDRRGVR